MICYPLLSIKVSITITPLNITLSIIVSLDLLLDITRSVTPLNAQPLTMVTPPYAVNVPPPFAMIDPPLFAMIIPPPFDVVALCPFTVITPPFDVVTPLLLAVVAPPLLAIVCNKLTGPPTQVVPQDHLCHHKWSPWTSCVRHKWSPTAISGPPYQTHAYLTKR